MHLAKLLVREGLVSVEQIREAIEHGRESGCEMGESLVDLGYVTESRLVEFLAKEYGVPAMDIDGCETEESVLRLVPVETALEKFLVPITVEGSDLVIAMSDPSNILLLDDLGFITGKNIKPVVASERSIKNKLNKYYRERGVAGSLQDGGLSVESGLQDKSNSPFSFQDKGTRPVDDIIRELELYNKGRAPASEISAARETSEITGIDSVTGSENEPNYEVTAGVDEEVNKPDEEADKPIEEFVSGLAEEGSIKHEDPISQPGTRLEEEVPGYAGEESDRADSGYGFIAPPDKESMTSDSMSFYDNSGAGELNSSREIGTEEPVSPDLTALNASGPSRESDADPGPDEVPNTLSADDTDGGSGGPDKYTVGAQSAGDAPIAVGVGSGSGDDTRDSETASGNGSSVPEVPNEKSSENAPLINGSHSIVAEKNRHGDRGSILIVEVSPTVRKIMRITLERAGYRVNAAGDGMQALARINETIPDLVFVDIKLPHMDGYQLCKVIKSHGLTKEVPVVMLSGKIGVLDKMKVKMAGANDFITRPFVSGALVEAAERYTK